MTDRVASLAALLQQGAHGEAANSWAKMAEWLLARGVQYAPRAAPLIAKIHAERARLETLDDESAVAAESYDLKAMCERLGREIAFGGI